MELQKTPKQNLLPHEEQMQSENFSTWPFGEEQRFWPLTLPLPLSSRRAGGFHPSDLGGNRGVRGRGKGKYGG